MDEDNHGLHRSERDHFLAGVCGGLAETWRIDPTVVRLVWVLFTLVFWVAGIFLYLVAWFVLPVGSIYGETAAGRSSEQRTRQRRLGQLVGWLLIGTGVFFLADQLSSGLLRRFFEEFRRYLWPIILITVGGFLLISRGPREGSEEDGSESA